MMEKQNHKAAAETEIMSLGKIPASDR